MCQCVDAGLELFSYLSPDKVSFVSGLFDLD